MLVDNYIKNERLPVIDSRFCCKLELSKNQFTMANIINSKEVAQPLLFDVPPYYKLSITILSADRAEIKIFSNSRKYQGKELGQWINMFGYLVTKMSNKIIKVHDLVALYTKGEKPEGYVIDHIDGNKLNNHPNNLEYVTIAENIRRSIALGFHVANDPKRSGRYKDGRCADRKAYKARWYQENKRKSIKDI